MGRDNRKAEIAHNAWEFQSTRPRGARPNSAELKPLTDTVSIHAPAWGATAESERDVLAALLFQSTRPRGARRFDLALLMLIDTCFNPRARVGRDTIDKRRSTSFPVSIHAPAWGATFAR